MTRGHPAGDGRPGSARPVLALLVGVVVAACGSPGSGEADGAALFEANCATCHGADLGGTSRGPSLLLDVSLPDSTSDEAIAAAITQGLPATRWEFGVMPAVGGLSEDEVDAVIAHVRDEQRRAGLIE